MSIVIVLNSFIRCKTLKSKWNCDCFGFILWIL